MSEIETTAGPLGVTVRYEGWYIAYFGSMEGLTAAGVATEPMFPVGRQKRRSSRLSKAQPGDPDGYFCCSMLKSGAYRVTKISPEFEHHFVADNECEQPVLSRSVIRFPHRSCSSARADSSGLAVLLRFPSGAVISGSGRNGAQHL